MVERPNEKQGAMLTLVRVPGAAKDFSPRVSFTVSVQPPCAIARINICAPVKNSTHRHMYIQTQTHVHTDTDTCTYTHRHMYIHTQTHVHTDTDTCTYRHRHMYIQTQTHVHTDTDTHTSIRASEES